MRSAVVDVCQSSMKHPRLGLFYDETGFYFPSYQWFAAGNPQAQLEKIVEKVQNTPHL